MMFNEKLVVCVKANGKILREFKDTVYLPYGTEFSVLLKNLNTVRALAHIYIDGDDVIDGGLILDPGRETTIERSVRNGNLDQGNRFKFIERTGSIENSRGVKVEDGLLRVEFQFEAPTPIWTSSLPKKWDDFGSPRYPMFYGSTGTGDYVPPSYSTNAIGSIAGASSADVSTKGITRSMVKSDSGQISNQTFGTCSASFNDVGITVPGSVSDQKFSVGHIGMLEATKHVIILRLLGEDPNHQPVPTPVTVKQKPKCVTCGRINKATSKFCTNCGTSLTII